LHWARQAKHWADWAALAAEAERALEPCPLAVQPRSIFVFHTRSRTQVPPQATRPAQIEIEIAASLPGLFIQLLG
jgi:hypothetical protein